MSSSILFPNFQIIINMNGGFLKFHYRYEPAHSYLFLNLYFSLIYENTSEFKKKNINEVFSKFEFIKILIITSFKIKIT